MVLCKVDRTQFDIVKKQKIKRPVSVYACSDSYLISKDALVKVSKKLNTLYQKICTKIAMYDEEEERAIIP